MSDLRYLVLNEHTLGYVREDAPSVLYVLNALCWKGRTSGAALCTALLEMCFAWPPDRIFMSTKSPRP